MHSSLMLALLCLIWGMTFPATKAALSLTDPVHFLAIRFSMASILFLPFLYIRRKQISGNSDVSPAELRKSFLLGSWVGLFLLAGFLLQVQGLKLTTASRSGFFTSLLTIIAPLLAWLFRTSKTHWATWIGLVPAMIGIYLLADPESGGLNKGDLLTIGCAFAFALQMVVLESVAGKSKNVLVLTYGQIITVTVGAITWSLIEAVPFQISLTGWVAAGYTGLFGTVIAVWMQTRYQPEVPAGHAALIFTLEPVFASLLAWILLAELWTLQALSGATMIFLAMIISSLGLYKISQKQGNMLRK